jgi:nucleoside-diphosphate-sugar epimerase
MRALVTGATSFPGRALVRRLLNGGDEVHALIRPSTDVHRLNGLPGQPALHVHDGGADTLAAIVAAIRPDTVFHLAGQYRREHRAEDVAPLVESNLTFGIYLLDAMRRAGIQNFVNTGSYFQNMDDTDARALNLYAALKTAFETVLAHYADAHDMRTTTLVLYDTYGEGDWRPKLMSAIRQSIRTGEPIRLPAKDGPVNFVHVDDVAEAFVVAAQGLDAPASDVAGNRFAVRLDGAHTIASTIAVFEKVSGRAVPKVWGAYLLPARDIRSPWKGPLLPGWRPAIGLEEGVRRFLAED